MRIQLEPFSFLPEETKDFWLEQGKVQGIQDQKINYRKWKDLDSTGSLYPFSFRRDGDLIGYAAFIRSYNYLAGFDYVTNLTLYIRPEHRGGNSVIVIINEIERFFREEIRVSKIIWAMNKKYAALERLDYKLVTQFAYEKSYD